MKQLYKVTLWDGTHTKAGEVRSTFHHIRETEEHPIALELGIINMIEAAINAGVEPVVTVGHIYDGDHSSTGWTGSNAITLEWNRHVAEEVMDLIVREKLVHYVMVTSRIGKKIDKDRIAFVFPLEEFITDKKDFQKVASRLFKDLQRPLLTPGSCAYTFMTKADIENPIVTFSGNDYEGDFVDPDYHLNRTGKDAYIVTADSEEGGL